MSAHLLLSQLTMWAYCSVCLLLIYLFLSPPRCEFIESRLLKAKFHVFVFLNCSLADQWFCPLNSGVKFMLSVRLCCLVTSRFILKASVDFPSVPPPGLISLRRADCYHLFPIYLVCIYSRRLCLSSATSSCSLQHWSSPDTLLIVTNHCC